jgi:hypothetical protein
MESQATQAYPTTMVESDNEDVLIEEDKSESESEEEDNDMAELLEKTVKEPPKKNETFVFNAKERSQILGYAKHCGFKWGTFKDAVVRVEFDAAKERTRRPPNLEKGLRLWADQGYLDYDKVMDKFPKSVAVPPKKRTSTMAALEEPPLKKKKEIKKVSENTFDDDDFELQLEEEPDFILDCSKRICGTINDDMDKWVVYAEKKGKEGEKPRVIPLCFCAKQAALARAKSQFNQGEYYDTMKCGRTAQNTELKDLKKKKCTLSVTDTIFNALIKFLRHRKMNCIIHPICSGCSNAMKVAKFGNSNSLFFNCSSCRFSVDIDEFNKDVGQVLFKKNFKDIV